MYTHTKNYKHLEHPPTGFIVVLFEKGCSYIIQVILGPDHVEPSASATHCFLFLFLIYFFINVYVRYVERVCIYHSVNVEVKRQLSQSQFSHPAMVCLIVLCQLDTRESHLREMNPS